MPEPVPVPSIRGLIVVPALITLAVTLLRLVGELQHGGSWIAVRELGVAVSETPASQ
jgi:hypothetical protein